MTEIIEKINADFNELIEELDKTGYPVHKETAELNEQFLQKGLRIYDKPIPTFLKPFFFSAERRMYINKASAAILSLMEKVGDLYFQGDEYKDIYKLTPEEDFLVNIPTHLLRKVKRCRLDAFATETELKYIEFNCDSPGGAAYTDTQVELLENREVMKRTKQKYDLGRDILLPQDLTLLITSYYEFGGSDVPRIAIVGGRESSTITEFHMIARFAKERGYPAIVCDPRDLEYNGKDLHYKDHKVNTILRRGWGRDWTDHMDEIKPLIKACQDGKVCVVNAMRCKLCDNKHLLAVIQEERMQKLFDEFERKVIRDHIPWTRYLEQSKTEYKGKPVDLYEFTSTNKDTLIMKPIDELGGKDVIIGEDATQEEWDAYLKDTVNKRCVVQEYCPIPEIDMPVADENGKLTWQPKKVNTNFYVYDGQVAGGFVRLSDSSVINISAGGGLVPIFTVKDGR